MDMLKKLMTCVLACLMIFLVACSNTAKEAALDETINETSFPAGNTQAQAEVEQTEEPQTAIVQEIPQTSVEENKEQTESKKPDTVSTAPVEEKPQAEAPEQTTETVPETKPKQPKESKPVETEPVEIPTEKPADSKPTEPPKQVFDVSPYVRYAKEYAVSIGLSLDSTATDCWDNPISANPNRSGIKSDIQSRLDRYKNSDGFTAVWIWAEKISDTEYEIYIGYC